MILTETALPGVYIVDVEPHPDERGFFARVWDGEALAAETKREIARWNEFGRDLRRRFLSKARSPAPRGAGRR